MAVETVLPPQWKCCFRKTKCRLMWIEAEYFVRKKHVVNFGNDYICFEFSHRSYSAPIMLCWRAGRSALYTFEVDRCSTLSVHGKNISLRRHLSYSKTELAKCWRVWCLFISRRKPTNCCQPFFLILPSKTRRLSMNHMSLYTVLYTDKGMSSWTSYLTK